MPSPSDLTRDRSLGRYVPPHDPLQYQLVEIWEKILGIRSIGVSDEFLKLGGTLVDWAAMLDAVHMVCGQRPGRVLRSNPSTIEALASDLIQQLEPRQIFNLQIGDRQRRHPIFFFHGDFNGGGLYSVALARALGAEQPVYAVSPHGFHTVDIPASIDQMADQHIASILSHQPEGPYFLGGHCNGGLVALETARRLLLLGKEIGCIVMIHAWYGSRPGSHATGVAMLDPASFSPPDRSAPARVWNAWRLNRYIAITRQHRPAPYPDKLVLLWPLQEMSPAVDPAEAWRRIAPKTEFQLIPGNHLTCITTHVQDLARVLNGCLIS